MSNVLEQLNVHKFCKAMQFVVLLCLLYLVSHTVAWLEIRHRWNEGYAATLHIPVRQEANGWQLVLEFKEQFTQLEVFSGRVESIVDNKIAFIVNQPDNPYLPPNQDFPLEFNARYNNNAPVAAVVKATFNGEPIACGQYDYGEVIQKSLLFYEAQRCGRLPPDNRIHWRGDSFLQDGQDLGLDLTGGYFDAGDHVKFGFPMASSTTLMGWGLLDYRYGYELAGELQNGHKALRWALDYFMKAHPTPTELYGQCGDGGVDHAYWGRPEDQTSSRPCWKITASAPGSDLAGETAAAFATGYLVFRDSDSAYADICLRHARELYDFANQYRGKYSDSIKDAANYYGSWGYGDELGWSAAWLWRATGEQKYLDDFYVHKAEFYYNWRPGGFGWDDKVAGIQILMAKLTNEKEFVDHAQNFCNYMVYEVPRTPKGLAFISEWGSLRAISNSAFLCLQAADAGINVSPFRQFVIQQMNYILGDAGRSFVVGFGNNPPTKPHHRASSCPNRPLVCDWNNAGLNPGPNYQTLTGALVGGPGINDDYVDDRNDYVKNEVACDYNAGFQGTVAGLLQLQLQPSSS